MTNNKQVNKKDGDQQQGGALKEAYKAEMAEVMKVQKKQVQGQKEQEQHHHAHIQKEVPHNGMQQHQKQNFRQVKNSVRKS
mmetsp:Transcript_3927/g.5807  ORF Transcript_3927/g.5807 Transcript_3927/m.5807 type:complete len:81 (+) Transcript_3927:49-291(+)